MEYAEKASEFLRGCITLLESNCDVRFSQIVNNLKYEEERLDSILMNMEENNESNKG